MHAHAPQLRRQPADPSARKFLQRSQELPEKRPSFCICSSAKDSTRALDQEPAAPHRGTLPIRMTGILASSCTAFSMKLCLNTKHASLGILDFTPFEHFTYSPEQQRSDALAAPCNSKELTEMRAMTSVQALRTESFSSSSEVPSTSLAVLA